MADPKIPTVMEILATVTGRAMRADTSSKDDDLPKDQRTFHAGRREAYLQMIALICGTDVKSIRPGVIGTRESKKVKVTTDFSEYF